MIPASALSCEEVAAHAAAIASAKSKEVFVVAFAAYARDVVARETDPYEKIALFVHGMIEGHQGLILELVRDFGGGSA